MSHSPTSPAASHAHGSFSGRPWVPAPAPEGGAQLVAAGVPALVADLLARRGILSADAAERFLRPAPDHLAEPTELADLDRAIAILARAREAGRPVVVVGDYDVDGVSATALLLAALRACGLEPSALLPDRFTDGYGLASRHVAEAVARGAGVLVTVDCGTHAHAEIGEALAAGLEVVVLDHHLPGDPLPAAVAFVNPKRADCPSATPDLAAAGLALKLALALGQAVGRPLPLEPLLRIACLGTVADMVPLLGENRVIAKLGLRALSRTRSVGLRALFQRARLRSTIGAEDVGFRIGPRINAAGRLGSAEPALELLLTRSPQRAAELCDELERLNRERQQLEERVVREALAQLSGEGDATKGGQNPREDRDRQGLDLPPLLVGWSADWHRGVVGIAASRVARDLGRPCLLLAVDGDRATGSGRGIPGIDLHAFLHPWADRLLRFGGHAGAVGLSAEAAGLEELRRLWTEAAASAWRDKLRPVAWEYEASLGCREVDDALARSLAALAPHGQGNPAPLLRVGPLRLRRPPRRFGKANNHARGRAEGPDGGRLTLLGWSWAERLEGLGEGWFDALGHLERDLRTGQVELRLLDARPAEAGA